MIRYLDLYYEFACVNEHHSVIVFDDVKNRLSGTYYKNSNTLYFKGWVL